MCGQLLPAELASDLAVVDDNVRKSAADVDAEPIPLHARFPLARSDELQSSTSALKIEAQPSSRSSAVAGKHRNLHWVPLSPQVARLFRETVGRAGGGIHAFYGATVSAWDDPEVGPRWRLRRTH